MGTGYTDAAVNTGVGNSDTVSIDRLNPTVAVNVVATSLSDTTNTSNVTFTFSEAPVGFDAADLTVVGGTVGAIVQDTATTYHTTFTATDGFSGAGSVTVNPSSYTDAAGNLGVTGSDTVTIDRLNPTVAVNIVAATLNATTNTSSVTFTFSEAPTGFTVGDITPTNGSISGFTQDSPTTYHATFTASVAGTGTVSVAAGSYTDAAGNAGGAGSDTVTFDTSVPTLNTITTTNLSNPQGSTATITFAFSEAVTAFTLSDLVSSNVNKATFSNLTTIDSITWTATATRGTANGSVQVSVANGSFTDLAGNPGTGLTSGNLPAGAAGEPINLALHNPAGEADYLITVSGVPTDWQLSSGTNLGNGTWMVQTNDTSALTVTTPASYAGALVLNVEMSWTNADGSTSSNSMTSNVEAYPVGSPIFAVSTDDTLTASSGADLLVFAQPIARDTVHNFDVAADKIDLIGFTGVGQFSDLVIANDGNGNAVITLGAGATITVVGVDAASLSASNFVFGLEPVISNTGNLVISDGAVMPFGGTIENSGTIALHSAGASTELLVLFKGTTLMGGGKVLLSDSAENLIVGGTADTVLVNHDNTISGAGQLGGGQMVLVNEATILADGSNALVIDTGSYVVSNMGLLEATGGGGLIVNSALVNTGEVWAHGGDVTLLGDVTGGGSAVISGGATLEFGAASDAAVSYALGEAGTLKLDHASAFSGTVSGFDADDTINLADLAFGNGLTAQYLANDAGTGGTLMLSDGVNNAQLTLLGQFQATGAQADGQGGTLLGYAAPALDFSLLGGASNDTLVGGAGNDLLAGGHGSDVLTGGLGVDTFKFSLADNGGTDTITDFTVAHQADGGDVLDIHDLLEGTGATSLNLDAFVSVREVDGNTVISVNHDGTSTTQAQDVAMLMGVTNLTLAQLIEQQQIVV